MRRFMSFLLAVPLVTLAMSTDGTTAFGQDYKAWPWSQRLYYGYKESPKQARVADPSAEPVAPKKYRLALTVVPAPAEMADTLATSASMMAHVPENAQVWFMGQETKTGGTMREYRSPRLEPGSNYVYTVRVDWVEDGRKVTQDYDFNVKVGAAHCIYLVQASSTDAKLAIEDSLSKLSPVDRKMAEEQGYCAVQPDNRLGIMGVPIKVTVKGTPVLLCCEGCRRKAIKDADKTLETVKELKENAGK